MLRLLAFCLLATPFVQGLSVPTDSLSAPSLTVMKSDHEFEHEVYENITKCAKKAAFVPHPHHNDEGEHSEHSPVHVKVNSYVRDILSIKTVDSDLYDWTMDLTFRQKWNDKRLAYDVTHHPDVHYITLNTEEGMHAIWKPDTFFSGSVKEELHSVTAPNALVWVFPNGDVLYSLRVTVTLRCHHNHPATPEKKEVVEGEEKESDLVCPMRIASYGFADDKVVYEWDEEENTPAVEVTKHLHLPHYSLDKVTREVITAKTRIAGFSSLNAKFHFTHK